MVEKKPQRQSRYTDKELALTNTVFAENYDLLKVLRKAIVQLPLSTVEEQMMRETFKGDVIDLIKKFFIPEMDGDSSLSNLTDKYFIHAEDRSLDNVYFDICVNKKKWEYLEQQVDSIGGIEKETIKLDDFVKTEGKKEGDICVDFATRSKIIQHVEAVLQAILIIAGKKDETVEQRLKRMEMDSSK